MDLIASAFMNIGGVLVFSRVFTNVTINTADPIVIKFPSLNPDVLRSKVENFIERFGDKPEENQS